MTPREAINQLKRDGFSEDEIVEAVLPMVKVRYMVLDITPIDRKIKIEGEWKISRFEHQSSSTDSIFAKREKLMVELLRVFVPKDCDDRSD